MKPLGRVKIKWSPKFAYALGLLASDGNLSTDGRHINFTSKDKDLVQIFKDCLGLEVKIGRKTSGYTHKKDYYQVQFGDVIFYKWLCDIGIGPKKSKTIGAIKIFDKYFFDFLRGSFDGDGTIYAYWDKRWRSSYMFYINFVSASLSHVEWMDATIYRLLKIKGHIKPSHNVHQLVYAKKGSKILFSKMFYKKGLPCLNRKFIKAKNIFKINEEHDNLSGCRNLVDELG